MSFQALESGLTQDFAPTEIRPFSGRSRIEPRASLIESPRACLRLWAFPFGFSGRELMTMPDAT